MTTENSPPQHDDDAAFDQELTRLYRAALRDEPFQQQVSQDLQTLPVTAQAALKPAEQAFVREETLSAAAQTRLLDMIPPCKQSQPARTKPQPWWRKLLASDWGSALLPRPAFSIPAALMTGMLFGVLLPTFLAHLTQPEYVTRGGDADKPTQITRPEPQLGAQNGITDAIRQNPQQWLEAIAELLRQGKMAQARAELQAFELQYPNYRP
ncbi:MAG: hypothetical protein BWK73_48885 [Thiothrix lacustris]|uniref:Uncharacterized protein n=1 Tax=Thiothrix lacustris TaxID=525917 RepID=A0A1Y1Q941_9GAMM|nr:MAG: hypothetical protein BWK73_48885 [Thiothrix lacustris]